MAEKKERTCRCEDLFKFAVQQSVCLGSYSPGEIKLVDIVGGGVVSTWIFLAVDLYLNRRVENPCTDYDKQIDRLFVEAGGSQRRREIIKNEFAIII